MDNNHKLYGAILGDLCGQPYEFPVMVGPYTNVNLHNPDSHFTDDTILTLATAYALLNNKPFDKVYREFGKKYVGDYYGKGFLEWINKPDGTIGYSHANGCLMRMSPIMYLNINEEDKINKVLESCICSHLNIDSLNSVVKLSELYFISDLIKKYNYTRQRIDNIRSFNKFEFKAKPTIEFINLLYHSESSTQGSIITAIECGGDTDTNASIIGELSNYTYNDITEEDAAYVESKLDSFLLEILLEFNKNY